MDPVSPLDIQRALINVSKSERAAITMPPRFPDIDWARLDFYGWRDPKFPQRGYLVRQQQDGLVALSVSTSGGGLTPGRKAMCTICHAVDNSSTIKLFTGRRTGPAGRAGNTIGTYVCADLDCSAQLRDPSGKPGRIRLSSNQNADEIATQMLIRLDAFIDAVRTP